MSEWILILYIVAGTGMSPVLHTQVITGFHSKQACDKAGVDANEWDNHVTVTHRCLEKRAF